MLACVLTATTKKVVNFFSGKKCTAQEKILAKRMNLPTPGKNPAGAHDPKRYHQRVVSRLSRGGHGKSPARNVREREMYGFYIYFIFTLRTLALFSLSRSIPSSISVRTSCGPHPGTGHVRSRRQNSLTSWVIHVHDDASNSDYNALHGGAEIL